MTCCPSKLGQMGSAFLLFLANLNFTFMPVFLGWVTKPRTIEAYHIENYFFVGLASFSLCIGITAFYIDTRMYDGVLMKQENDEAVRRFKGEINREYELILGGGNAEIGAEDYRAVQGQVEADSEDVSIELDEIRNSK